MYHLSDGLQQPWHTRDRETIPGEGGQSWDETLISTKGASLGRRC